MKENRKRLIKIFVPLLLMICIDLNIYAGGNLMTIDYNYINDLIGGRATGMAGAYTAISDDPSGSYYNPAGIVFAIDNQISLSVNSYKNKEIAIKKVLLQKEDYTQDISSFYPSFFGIVQSLGPLKFAITIININNELLDQDNYYPLRANGINIYSINYNITDNTLLGGVTAASFITDSLTAGFTLYGLRRRTEQINTQITIFGNDTYSLTNSYFTDMIYGGIAKFGMQWMPSKQFSVGCSVSLGQIFSHKRQNQIFEKGAYDENEDPIGDNYSEVSFTKGEDNFNGDSNDNNDSELPVNVRFGVAWFPSSSLIISADVIFDYITFSDYNDDFSMRLFDKNVMGNYYQNRVVNTVNFAIGAEYFIVKSFPVRLGFFTNLANTPAMDKKARNQEMHTNIYGVSASLGWQTRNSSISLSGFYQYGVGEFQAFEDLMVFQYVVIKSFSISLTGSAKY